MLEGPNVCEEDGKERVKEREGLGKRRLKK